MSVGVGVIGCGNISEVYLVNAKLFRDIRVVACAGRRQPSVRLTVMASSPPVSPFF